MKIAMSVWAGAAVICLGGLVPFGATAQEGAPVDDALLQQGRQIYEGSCAACHQVTGAGRPPVFPALAGNENLGDPGLIVHNVHSGKGAMPAFPNLSAEDIAAVATYVRNTWGNAFGGVTVEEVDALLASGDAADAGADAAGAEGAARTIWSGVFTAEQADRGSSIVAGSCAKCHGTRLNGAGEPDQMPSPAIARAGFLRNWDGQSLQALFTYIQTTMPKDNPGQLDPQQTADALAHMLEVSGAEPGSTELPADPEALAGITITQQPE